MRPGLYDIKSKRDFLSFEFVSEGPKGKITKQVQYTKTRIPNLYILGFGDKNLLTGDLDDTVTTNNGDSQKVIATVAATVETFLKHYPRAFIYATGSNKVRTRLYRILISNNLGLIKTNFQIFGLKDDKYDLFKKNIDYDGFLLCRKNINL